MKKVVNFCGNCIFLYNEYNKNDNSVQHLCVLSKNLESHFDYVDTVEGVFDENSTPDWCPLKVEDYTFSFKDLSNNRLIDINNVKEKINDENITQKEISSDDIQNEINKSIEEIKNQMNYIEEASVKLQDLFSKYSVE